MDADAEDRPLSPRSLVLDVLSVVEGHVLPVRTLVQAGERVGLSSNGLRVALSRLRNEGKVTLVERGTYALSPAARKRNRQVLAWRDVLASRVPWEGDFWGAVPAAGERDERALRSLGFRPLTTQLFVRPANLRGGLEGARRQLVELGLSSQGATFAVTDLDVASSTRAIALWNHRELAEGYRVLAASLRESAARVRSLPADEALREMFVLGGRAIRAIVLDPRLPDELAPPAALAALIATMDRYDTQGRKLWARHLDVPVTVRLPAAPADWAVLRDALPRAAGVAS